MPDDDRDEAEQGTGCGTAEGPGSQATASEIFVGYELGFAKGLGLVSPFFCI